MKKFISYFSYALSVLMVFSVASCSSDDIFEDMDLTDDKKEAKTWKERLDKGEIIYVAKQRAFIEVKTGKVLRKL